MTYYDHNERVLFDVKGLSLIGKGLWPGDFDSLHSILMQFSERNVNQKFGDYLCRFRVMTTDDSKLITTRAGNESLWLIGTSWKSDCDVPVPLTEVIEDGKVYQVYPNNPHGKVIGTKVATGLRVELWHDADNIDAVATQVYTSKLYQKLVEDGLKPTEGLQMGVIQIISAGLRTALENGYYEGAFPPAKSLVNDFRYPGELNHFKAFMKRLIDSELAYWEASNGVWLECQDTFPPDPTMPVGRWHIRTQLTSNPDAWATMIAYGEKADETHVCFYDGFNSISEPHERPRLGPILLELTDFIENQAGPVSARQKMNEQAAVPKHGVSVDKDNESLLNDVVRMKKHYSGYSPDTAKKIYKAVPKAWELYTTEGGRWGPGFIARIAPVNSTTVGRYLKAFKAEGLTETIEGIKIP